MKHKKTKAVPPDRLLLYLLGKDDKLLESEIGLVVYQKDLALALNAIKWDDTELGVSAVQLATLLSSVTIFPSEPYKPTLEEIEKLRCEIDQKDD